MQNTLLSQFELLADRMVSARTNTPATLVVEVVPTAPVIQPTAPVDEADAAALVAAILKDEVASLSPHSPLPDTDGMDIN